MTGLVRIDPRVGRVGLPWLRPAAVATVTAAHVCAALFLTIARPVLPSSVDSIEITIAAAQPEPAPEIPAAKAPDPEPPPPPPPPPEVPVTVLEPPPEPMPPIAAEPPKREAPDAPVIPRLVKPKPQPKIERPRLAEPPPPEPVAQPASPPPEPPPGLTASPDQQTAARATYASRLLEEIRKHRLPAQGVGSVGVAFSVDASGDMASVTIVQSSGNRDLDNTALRMVRAARPGPPPGGSFSGSTTINFVTR